LLATVDQSQYDDLLDRYAQMLSKNITACSDDEASIIVGLSIAGMFVAANQMNAAVSIL
jgi:hypothetical protein